MAAPISSYDAKTLLTKKYHLGIPSIRGKGPTMRKKNGLAFAPVFIINMSSVFSFNSAHNPIQVCVL
jgi:hypothetical protein